MPDLRRLLCPRSIAVVGGGSWGLSVIEQSRKMGFDGPVWAVHPDRPRLGDVSTVPRVSDLPSAPDAVFVGVNRHATIDVVRDLAQMGAGGAVCFASGFAEAKAELDDGADLQAQLLDAAGDMPILGPNCYGFINYLDGALLWPDQQGGQRVARGVALILQSSNIAINLTMQRRGLPFAYVVTVGNQAQQGIGTIGRALLDDPRVTGLGLYIEGIGDGAAFAALAARAHDLGKPIVALKIGRSQQAQIATVSHTASLAGSAAGADALLARLGIGQVGALTALLETLKLLHHTGPLASNRIASLSCSGGEASLIADSAARFDIAFPDLAPGQIAGLRAALGPSVALANPLDYNTYIWGDVPAMAATYGAMMQGDIALGCILVDLPRADRCDPKGWDCVIEAAALTRRAAAKPIALIATLPEGFSEVQSARIAAAGLIPLRGLEDALTAISVAAKVGRLRPGPVWPPSRCKPTHTLTETAAKAALSVYGVTVPKGSETTRPLAPQAADHIGYPLAVKGIGLAHKTEARAVHTGIANALDLKAALEALPGEAVLLEQMIIGGVAELLVGVLLDPAHGYLLTIGAGGILTELWADSQTLILPVDRDQVVTALRALRIAPLLSGYRGAQAANLDAIVAAVLAVQSYVLDNLDTVTEVEINPLICTPDQAVAVDALIRKGHADG